MEPQVLIIFVLIGITILLFAFELFSPDKTAFLALVACMLLGLVTPEEAIAGFANPAVITILALMILASALERNGVIHLLTARLAGLASWSYWLIVPIFMLIVGSLSSFISTTAVVIVFIKLVSQLNRRFGLSQRKLLLPISFAGILGGSCTLMGTSTNLLVNSIIVERGHDALGFFSFTAEGVIFFLVAGPIIAILSILLFSKNVKSLSLQESYDIPKYVTTIIIPPGSPLIGQRIRDTFLAGDEIQLLRMLQDGQINFSPNKLFRLVEGASVMIKTDVAKLTELEQTDGIKLLGIGNSENEMYEALFELVLLPSSPYLGLPIGNLSDTLPDYMRPIGIKQHRSIMTNFGFPKRSYREELKLQIGDRLLVGGSEEELQSKSTRGGFILLASEEQRYPKKSFKRIVSTFSLMIVVATAATGTMSILASALLGVAICIVFGAIDLREAYRSVSWPVIFLLAGMIPLGTAMQNTGADQFVATQLSDLLTGQEPIIMLCVLYFIAMLMSGFISNNATAIILTPVALSTATIFNLPIEPFVLAVMFASNYSFFTPIGYQTNALIYDMGIYRFRDFVLIGGIVSVVLWISVTFVLASWYF